MDLFEEKFKRLGELRQNIKSILWTNDCNYPEDNIPDASLDEFESLVYFIAYESGKLDANLEFKESI